MCSIPRPENGAERISSESALTTQDYMVYLNTAKNLKHNADAEEDRCMRALKYLEASIYFILTGNGMENDRDTAPSASVRIYQNTLTLFRYVSSMFVKEKDEASLNKIFAVICLRCQSLLSLKIYTMRSMEYNAVKAIQEGRGCSVSPEMKKGSLLLQDTKSKKPVPSSIHSVLVKQYQHTLNLTNAYELWMDADKIVFNDNLQDFFNELDRLCGPLTLHSSLTDLVDYSQYAIRCLKERSDRLAKLRALKVQP